MFIHSVLQKLVPELIIIIITALSCSLLKYIILPTFYLLAHAIFTTDEKGTIMFSYFTSEKIEAQ